MNKIFIPTLLFSAGIVSAASPSPTPNTWSKEWYANNNGHLLDPETVAVTRTKNIHGPQRLVFRTNMVKHFANGGCMADEVVIYSDGNQEDLVEFFGDAKYVPKVKIVEREGVITELPEALHKLLQDSLVQVLDVTKCSLTDKALEQLTASWTDAGKKPEDLLSSAIIMQAK